MSIVYNVSHDTLDCVCAHCTTMTTHHSIKDFVNEGWGIKLYPNGYVRFMLCPDCKVEYDLKLIQEKYGNREDLSYGELVAVQEEWYND